MRAAEVMAVEKEEVVMGVEEMGEGRGRWRRGWWRWRRWWWRRWWWWLKAKEVKAVGETVVERRW